MVTFKPRDSKIVAIEAAAIPFPKEETTPPVTKINFVMITIPVLECVILTQILTNKKVSGCLNRIFIDHTI